MKSLSILFIAFFLYNMTVGQTSEHCGTKMPDEMRNWLRNYKKNEKGIANKQADESTLYIPLKIHIVGTDNGIGYHKTEHLLESLCHLNSQYEPYGIRFYLYEDIDYFNNSDVFDHSESIGNSLRFRNDENAANIYYVQNPAGGGYFSWWGDFIAVAKSCAGSENSTVAHELGHYFSLPHTFDGWEGRDPSKPPRSSDERVDGSNCDRAGDEFCDTPADYLSNRWSCPNNSTKLDYNGDPYEVDSSLFMSYSSDVCQSRFSNEQVDAMKAFITTSEWRSFLISHPDPVIQEVAETHAVYPVDGAPNVPANYVNLKWRVSEGATHYSLLVTRHFSGSYYQVDMILEDTSIVVTNLDPGFEYRWKVRPFNAANTCTGYTDYNKFTTTDSTSIVPGLSVESESCPGNSDGSISVNATGGSAPYSYHWSTGETSGNLKNLAIGNYMLTISDANSESLVLSVDIGGPNELDADFVQQDVNLVVVGNGGDPPYTYSWSDGSVISTINMSEAGIYDVTITDNKGCSATKSFYFSNVVEELKEENFNIYPNPVTGSESLTVEIKSVSAFDGNIGLFDNTGKNLILVDKTFQVGTNIETMDLSKIGQGIYHIRILSQSSTLTKKVVIF